MSVSTSALELLQQRYDDRLSAAREAHAQGIGVIGLIGNTVPRELVLALDRFAVLVAAQTGVATPIADTYMEPVIPPETRALFEAAVGGAFEFFDLLVLTRPYAQLYYYLKEVYRGGRAPKLPPLHMFDLMPSRRDAVRAYNWQQTERLIARLERLSGAEINDSALGNAIDLTNRVRVTQRRLMNLRWQGKVSGVRALQAIGAGYFMDPRAYADALESYVAESDPRTKPRVLVLPSEPLSDVHLHQAIEDAGALVVAEDDWWGSRAPGDDIAREGSARESIFLKYWQDTASSGVLPAEVREAWFMSHAARPDVDGVIFYLPPSDHQLGWDYPRLRDWLTERGKRSLLVRQDAAHDPGEITRRVSQWL